MKSQQKKRSLLLVGTVLERNQFMFEFFSNQDIDVYVALAEVPEWLTQYVPQEHLIFSDIYTAFSLVSDVTKYASEKNIIFDAVGTLQELVVVQTALLRKALGCTGVSPEAAAVSSANKFAMRTACRNADIPTPRFELLRGATRETLTEAIASFGTPCVVKPVLLGGSSVGVKKFDMSARIEDVEEIFTMTERNPDPAFKNFVPDFLIEEYIVGEQMCVDGFIQKGNVQIAGITDIQFGPEPHFVDEANYIPSSLSKEQSQKVKEFVTTVVHALKFDNCLFHSEVRLKNETIQLIEIACRVPGGKLILGYEHAFGYNLLSNVLDIWMGDATELVKKYEKYVVQKIVVPKISGKVSELHGTERVSSVPGVWDFKVITDRGDSTQSLFTSTEPIYYYAAEAASRAELEDIMDKVEKTVSYTITPTS